MQSAPGICYTFFAVIYAAIPKPFLITFVVVVVVGLGDNTDLFIYLLRKRKTIWLR